MIRQRPTAPMTSTASARIFRSSPTQVYGKPLVYLDNAASAQKPQAVLDRINQAYTSQYANVHRGLHYLANEATEPTRARARKWRRSSMPGARKRSSSPATPPRRSISSPIRSARAHQGRRRDHALDHGAPLQYRAVAFPARAPGRGHQVGAGRRRRAFPASTNSRSYRRRAPRWWRSPICRTCSARWCR